VHAASCENAMDVVDGPAAHGARDESECARAAHAHVEARGDRVIAIVDEAHGARVERQGLREPIGADVRATRVHAVHVRHRRCRRRRRCRDGADPTSLSPSGDRCMAGSSAGGIDLLCRSPCGFGAGAGVVVYVSGSGYLRLLNPSPG